MILINNRNKLVCGGDNYGRIFFINWHIYIKSSQAKYTVIADEEKEIV